MNKLKKAAVFFGRFAAFLLSVALTGVAVIAVGAAARLTWWLLKIGWNLVL